MLKEDRQVLLLINDAEVCKKTGEYIRDKFGFGVEIAGDGEIALALIKEFPWQFDVAVIYDDLNEDSKSLYVLGEIKKNYPEIEVIYIINSEKNRNQADEWREGAFNCFFRPINFVGIVYSIKIARDQAQFRRERKMLAKFQQLSNAISSATELHEIQNLACQAAVEIFNSDHSGLVEFKKDLSLGKVIAEYPGPHKFIEAEIKIKGIPLEEMLVSDQEIINVANVAECNALGEVQKKLLAFNISSLLIVPVVLKNKVIASISLDMIGKNRFFYPDEIDLIKKLADQIAVAIGKARHLKELSILNDIARDIGATEPASLNIKEMLGKVKARAGELLDVTNFYIALYDEKKEEYSFPFHEDEKEEVDTVPKEKMRKGLTEYVRNLKQPILVDKKKDQQLVEEGIVEMVGEPTCIWLGAPLIARGKVLGVMVIQDYHNEKAYDEHDLKILETIASQTAVALDNAKLFEARIRDQEILNNIIQTISTKLDTGKLFQAMVTQVTEKLKCSHCTIFLHKKVDGEIKLVPQTSHGEFSKQVLSRIFKLDEGLAGWVYQHGQSIVESDARSDPRYAAARQRADKPRSMLVAPIKVGNRTIGVISADQDEKSWFNESDRQLVDTLAQHAGIAIERALGLNLLQDVGQQLISSEDENRILQRIVTGAIELTDTTAGILNLISDDGKTITKRFTYPTDFNPPPPRMDNKDGLTRHIIDTGEMDFIPDIEKDTRVKPWLFENGFRSIIGIPLKIAEKVVGVLYLNSKESRQFSETECSLLAILAGQAAIAIYNSHLFRESQKHLKEIETLYNISKEIAGKTTNIKSLMDTILIKALEISNADSAQIVLKDEAKNQYKLVLTQGLPVLKGVVLEEDEGLSPKVFETGMSLYTGDYHSHPERAKKLDAPKYKKLYNSLALVPLKWKEEVLGAIALTSSSFNKFTEDDKVVLERFSGPAAIALAIAREVSFRQTLLDNSPDAIIAVNRKGIIKEFNKTAESISGYTMDEIKGHSIIELWGTMEEAKQIKRMMYEKEDGKIHRMEIFLKSKSGERIPVLFSGSILYSGDYDEDREEIGSICQIEDQRIISLRGRTRRLVDAIEEINRSEELPKLLHVVLSRAKELLGADSGEIILKRGSDYIVVEKYNFDTEEADKISLKIDDENFILLINKGISKILPTFPPPTQGIPISGSGKSGLVIPLKIEDNIIGSIYLESNTNDYFRREDELLQILSSEASVAINRVQLKEESEQLQLLKEIGDRIRLEGQFDRYKNFIAETSQELLGAETSAILLYDKSTRCLCGKARFPAINEWDIAEESYSDEDSRRGITGQVLGYGEREKGAPVECDGGKKDYIIYSDEKEIIKEALPENLEKYKCLPSWKKIREASSAESPIYHFLAVPIFGEKGKVFGALRVMNKKAKEYSDDNPILDGQGFREPEDVQLLKTIASLLSQALSSERKAEKLRMLHKITDEISLKMDIKGIGDCLTQSIVTDFGYSACSMRLVRGEYIELISEFGFRSDSVKTIRKDEGLAGRILKSGNVVHADDIFSENQEPNGGFLNKDFSRQENIRSVCGVPIKGRDDEVIAVVFIYMRRSPYQFEEYEIYENFYPISTTCSIALRKVEAVNHLQKLVELLGLVHLSKSRFEILDVCMDEMLAIFDAHSAVVFESRKLPAVDPKVPPAPEFVDIYKKNTEYNFDIPAELLQKIQKSGPLTVNSNEFPKELDSVKGQYSQCLMFTLDFQEETQGMVMLFTKMGIPFILHEIDRFNLASAVSKQLAIAFKNIEIKDEIERIRVSQPAIISAQYVSGMIHELASSAHKGLAAAAYIRGTEEFRAIDNKNWKNEMSKVVGSFDSIVHFTTRALEIRNMARSNFIRDLEFRSINDAIRDVIHDCTFEARKKMARIDWDYDKVHDQRHAYFDGILIKQAIRNLISNSIKWVDRDIGKITITSGEKDNFIFVRVEDNGWGVDPKIEKSIFDPFFTTSTSGYGIGLFFVQNVAKMHEGDVKLVRRKEPTIFEFKISSRLKGGGNAHDSDPKSTPFDSR